MYSVIVVCHVTGILALCHPGCT